MKDKFHHLKYSLIHLFSYIQKTIKHTAMLNQELIDHFYNSFKNKNAEAMIACYHDDVEFSDPAFGLLKGSEAKSMWQMLIERGKDSLQIDYNTVSADSENGKAKWIAHYNFVK